MFTIFTLLVGLVLGVALEKYLSDVFEDGRALTFSFSTYLYAATLGLVRDLWAIFGPVR